MGVSGIEGVGRAGGRGAAGVPLDNAQAAGEGTPSGKDENLSGLDTGKPLEDEAPQDAFSADDSALEDDEPGGGASGQSLDVDVEDLDPGSVVDLSAGAVQAETLNLDVGDPGESTRALQDSLVARETKQREEEKSAEQARTRRDELTEAHDGIEDTLQHNQYADSAIDARRDSEYASIDRAVSARHDLSMRSGTSSAAGAGARAPMVAQQSRSAEQGALQRIDELDRYKVSTQMNLRNAEAQLRQNSLLQAQARENERQHVANGRAACEQTQALRQLTYQLGSNPSPNDRDASGIAQTVENQVPGETTASSEQPGNARKRRDVHPADATAQADDRSEGIDDDVGQRLYGPAFRLRGDRNRLVLDLSRLDRPRVDVTA